jgi:hypothetical protein
MPPYVEHLSAREPPQYIVSGKELSVDKVRWDRVSFSECAKTISKRTRPETIRVAKSSSDRDGDVCRRRKRQIERCDRG